MATENPRVWFKSILLGNVRSFGENQTINFTENGTKDGSPARWNLILGDNGTGKTTVLKALSILSGRFSERDIISMLRYDLSKPTMYGIVEKEGNLIQLSSSIQIYVHRHGGPYLGKSDLNYNRNILGDEFVIYGYGAARRIGNVDGRQDETNTVSTLFDETAQLSSAESWLLEAELSHLKGTDTSGYYELVKESLIRLFFGEVKDIKSEKHYSSTSVFFETHYGDVMMHELSLGYKTLIAWVVDFAKGLFTYYPNSPDPLAEPAVCLVDEIDLHLHPKFQRTIIQFLTDTFPNTQFIVTAHSPLIVQSAGDANIIVLKREGNETVVETDRINVHDWRIDQILSSDMFGGIGGRAPDVEEKMIRRRALLRKDELTEAEKIEFATLEKELGNLPVSESREALKALDIIGQALINQ